MASSPKQLCMHSFSFFTLKREEVPLISKGIYRLARALSLQTIHKAGQFGNRERCSEQLLRQKGSFPAALTAWLLDAFISYTLTPLNHLQLLFPVHPLWGPRPRRPSPAHLPSHSATPPAALPATSFSPISCAEPLTLWLELLSTCHN